MSLIIGDKPEGFDKKTWQARYDKDRDKRPDRVAAKKGRRKSITDTKYLGRKFIAVDGEGTDVEYGPDKGKQLYTLLAVSGAPILEDMDGLSTRRILDYLWDNLDSGPETINVIFGGSYDFNMWIRDLREGDVAKLYKSSYDSSPVEYAGYGLRWIKGKAFEISKVGPDDKAQTLTINDVISFFQCSFIEACTQYLGYDFPHRDIIVREKARRGKFTRQDAGTVALYNSYELELLTELMNELRLRLNRVNLRPRRWNSPGAIAAALFSREGVKDHLDKEVPPAVAKAAQYAYAGGRFEMLKYGSVKETVYEYDITSADPRALLEMPSLANGTWKHHGSSDNGELYRFALYRVRFSIDNGTSGVRIPGPVFVRSKDGSIYYPTQGENWVWTPEYEALKEYGKRVKGVTWEVREVWEFQESTDVRPFAFVADIYRQRQELKAAGDGAQLACKLALNSLYGKTAQQIGWSITKDGSIRKPPYHQIEWAGFVTSWCRANVLRAALLDMEAIIAFETDALFSSRPLPVQVGTALGDWEESRFKSLTYVQSGHYYATTEDGKEVVRCRGIDKGFISRRNVEKLLRNPEETRFLKAKLTRFTGAGIALMQGMDKWCRWLVTEKDMKLYPTGKRRHWEGSCRCQGHAGLELGYWHDTYVPSPPNLMSYPFPIEWVNDPDTQEMTALEEMRNSENFYED